MDESGGQGLRFSARRGNEIVTDPDKPAEPNAPAYVTWPALAVVLVVAVVAATACLWWVRAAGTPTTAGRAPAQSPQLQLATCTGSIDTTTEADFWVIPLTNCDKGIDALDLRSGFLSRWTICGGSDSFQVSLNPRTVTVTGEHFSCSRQKSEVTVTYLGYSKGAAAPP
jgi:hypothetical protein